MQDIELMIQKLGITLNAMQKEAEQAILHSESDVIVLSPTGSGKTLAYLLPLVQLLDSSSDDLQAIVVVPGRELALQSDAVLKSLASGIRSMACYGGRTAMEEHRKMKEIKPQIIFGTPGRLNDHLSKGNVLPSKVHCLVIDEFDKCLDMGFEDEMRTLSDQLPVTRRQIFLSATDAEQLPSFVTSTPEKGRPVRIDYRNSEEPISDRVKIYEVKSPDKDKLETLRLLLSALRNESSIVFVNFRESVERVNAYLQEKGFVTSAFHGGMEQKDREVALYKFANGSANILVSTNLASRGLDISNIDNIIHYHLPETEEDFVHRVGRTARWKSTGNSFFILGPEERIPDYVDEKVNDYPLDPHAPQVKPALPKMATVYIGKGKKDKVSRGDIVGFLCKKGGLKGDEIGKIDVLDRYAYAAVPRSKLRQMLQLIKGEKIKGLHTIIEEAI
ncbi:DEAD/DEAH box helicase [Prevotella cerevisiae]|jgi:superfamily II DNA/RNA helicase|uniref:DEAD/DEAH box helicase n=1 Tax=Segatella cerevisiae TaxID=2053716 RepID=A0ABT1BVK0_9BACT|nr:DEAD/DEAH box helicase [Segatella cerevisiae]MCH3993611.1 DEAD/DEAH box helicase [Prevotella sp.]MCO6025104.1 DEAD/DEAH box helicase [Segatella cerevisiae]